MGKLLSARAVAAITEPGRYAVGHGAYLQITQGAEQRTKSWVFRYMRDGKARHVGMGSCEYVTLQEARDRAYEYRRLLAKGIDPLEQKHAGARAEAAERARAKTFKDCALEYIKEHRGGWRGDASHRQWMGSLETHVFPKIGTTPVGEIDVAAVLSVLDPMGEIPETRKRVQRRIAAVLEWAALRNLRAEDNPARRKLFNHKRAAANFAALPYTAMPAFMVELEQRQEMAARALEFLILTAARPSEALGARWSEIDMASALWTIPGERMKGGREHRVPLSGRAIELLAKLPREAGFLFLGHRGTGSKPHNMVIGKLLQRMGHSVTTHGFRATFRTWAGERTNYPREIVEAALAHVVGDATEQAYARGDMLARRRQLMEAWTKYVSEPDTANGVVVPLRAKEGGA